MLVDTHVLVWFLEDNPRLGERTRGVLTRGGWRYSPVSVAELLIKSLRGRFPLRAGFVGSLTDLGLTELALSGGHAAGLTDLPEALSGHDPFDRLLVAQAAVEGMAFATVDRRLLAAGLPHVVDARV